jgi:hypothetical protein
MARIRYQEAAGLEVKRGRPRRIVTPAMKKRLRRLYVEEGFSLCDVAAAMKIKKETVRLELKAAGVIRTNAPRSRLRLFDQARLFGYIAAFGVRKTAKRWRIPERTLKHYLAKLRAQK